MKIVYDIFKNLQHSLGSALLSRVFAMHNFKHQLAYNIITHALSYESINYFISSLFQNIGT